MFDSDVRLRLRWFTLLFALFRSCAAILILLVGGNKSWRLPWERWAGERLLPLLLIDFILPQAILGNWIGGHFKQTGLLKEGHAVHILVQGGETFNKCLLYQNENQE